MTSIKTSVDFILDQENIKTRKELDIWCGNKGRKKLYNYVQIMCPETWNKLKEPHAGVRAYYESRLVGYKANSISLT